MVAMTKNKGRPPTSQDQIQHVLSLNDAGLSPAEILAHPDTEVGLTTIYTVLKYNKKANPDRPANSTPPDMENGGSECSQFTVTA